MGGSFQRTATARLVPVSVPPPPLVWVVFGEGRNHLHPRSPVPWGGGSGYGGIVSANGSCTPSTGFGSSPPLGLGRVWRGPQPSPSTLPGLLGGLWGDRLSERRLRA